MDVFVTQIDVGLADDVRWVAMWDYAVLTRSRVENYLFGTKSLNVQCSEHEFFA